MFVDDPHIHKFLFGAFSPLEPTLANPSNWWLYQLKACVRSGVIHLTLKRTRGPSIQTHRRHQLPRSPLFTPLSMPHKRLAPRLPTYSPLSFTLLFAPSPSFSHSFSSALQLAPSHRPLLPHRQHNQLLQWDIKVITNSHLSLFSWLPILSDCCPFSSCPLSTLCWPLLFSFHSRMATKDRAGNSTISLISIGLTCESYPSVSIHTSASRGAFARHTRIHTNTCWAGGATGPQQCVIQQLSQRSFTQHRDWMRGTMPQSVSSLTPSPFERIIAWLAVQQLPMFCESLMSSQTHENTDNRAATLAENSRILGPVNNWNNCSEHRCQVRSDYSCF